MPNVSLAPASPPTGKSCHTSSSTTSDEHDSDDEDLDEAFCDSILSQESREDHGASAMRNHRFMTGSRKYEVDDLSGDSGSDSECGSGDLVKSICALTKTTLT